MQTFLVRIIIVVIIIVIAWFPSLIWAADNEVEKLRKLPFRQQLIKSNKVYLHDRTKDFLRKLNAINGEIEKGKEYIKNGKRKTFSNWLDIGDKKEKEIVKLIKEEEGEEECDLRMISVIGNEQMQKQISQFKAEYESKKDVCAVLIVYVTINTTTVWTIAGFNDEEEFKEKLIDDPNNELAIELDKEEPNRNKIIELSTSYLGRTREEEEGLIDFHDKHNNRIKKWTKEESLPSQYLRPFKMEAKLVKDIKQKLYPEPWRYVAVHWYPQAINLQLHNHPIPKDGLELTPDKWKVDDVDVQRYAFFSFYRKTRHEGKFNKDFLNNETGYGSFWYVKGKIIKLYRWKYLYNKYEYIGPDRIPFAEAKSLKSFILNNTCWTEKGRVSLDSLYNAKLVIFHYVLSEMENAVLKRENYNTYLGLYTFICQTFPCISAFKLEKVKYGNGLEQYRFVDGYIGDAPASGEFNGGSVIGHIMRLFNTRQTVYINLLKPILLLQFEIPDIDAIAKGRFPYKDLKVGFKGFLDLYKGFVSKAQDLRTQNINK